MVPILLKSVLSRRVVGITFRSTPAGRPSLASTHRSSSDSIHSHGIGDNHALIAVFLPLPSPLKYHLKVSLEHRFSHPFLLTRPDLSIWGWTVGLPSSIAFFFFWMEGVLIFRSRDYPPMEPVWRIRPLYLHDWEKSNRLQLRVVCLSSEYPSEATGSNQMKDKANHWGFWGLFGPIYLTTRQNVFKLVRKFTSMIWPASFAGLGSVANSHITRKRPATRT